MVLASRLESVEGTHLVRGLIFSRKRSLFLGLCFGVVLPSLIGQMVSPSIDKDGQPFSYFSKPTDEIGVMDAPSATEITPEGYLYTGFGELMFFTGPEKTPVSERIRTLQDGFLPIVSYDVLRDGLRYRFTMFSASLGEQPEGAVVNFVRVSVSNPTAHQETAFLTTALRYQGPQLSDFHSGENRFRRPVTAKELGDYQQPGELFNPKWVYGFEHNACLRDGRVLYSFPEQPAPRLNLTLFDHYNRISSLKPEVLSVAPTTPTCSEEYKVVLPPGAERSLDFKMPLLPVHTDDATFAQIQQAQFDDYRSRVARFWTELVNRGLNINVPEAKVNETFKANLIYDLMARNKIGNDYIQTVNQLHYHAFYLRDSSDIVRMYDISGYPKIAGQVLEFFGTKQQADGNFLSQPGQYDGWGQALWSYGEHYRMTHDKAFAASVYPRIVRAVDWLEKARASDPLHIMPATDVKDNEYVPGHLTGYNFLALDGLRAAIVIAKDLGHDEEASRFQKDYEDYRSTFLDLLGKITSKTGGYIPPDVDGNVEGTDWGNLLAVTPEQVLAPNDPRVTATLKESQSKYEEGLITYRQPEQGIYLHHYLTIKNTLTEVIRGEQEQALREFYAELMHTSSTHAGFEFAIRPWGTRDFQGNLSPHGWFAAEIRNLLRSMMVREQEDSLHLLSVLSPEWVGRGKSIHVDRAVSYFGTTGFDLEMPTDSEAILHLHNSFVVPPHSLVVHLPWFMQVSRITADGKAISPVAGAVSIPLETRELRIQWSRKPSTDSFSYAKAVADYKAEYKKRYQHLLETGEGFDAKTAR